MSLSIGEIMGELAGDVADSTVDYFTGDLFDVLLDSFSPDDVDQYAGTQEALNTINNEIAALASQVATDVNAICKTIDIEYSNTMIESNISVINSGLVASVQTWMDDLNESLDDITSTNGPDVSSALGSATTLANTILDNDASAILNDLNKTNDNLTGAGTDDASTCLISQWTQLYLTYMQQSGNDGSLLAESAAYLQNNFLSIVWCEIQAIGLWCTAVNTPGVATTTLSYATSEDILRLFQPILNKQVEAFLGAIESLVLSQLNIGTGHPEGMQNTNWPAIPSAAAEVFLQADLVAADLLQEEPGLRGRYIATPDQMKNNSWPTLEPGFSKGDNDFGASKGTKITQVTSSFMNYNVKMVCPISTDNNSTHVKVYSFDSSDIGIIRYSWDWPTGATDTDKLQWADDYGIDVQPEYYDLNTYEQPETGAETGGNQVLYANFTVFDAALTDSPFCDWSNNPGGWSFTPNSKGSGKNNGDTYPQVTPSTTGDTKMPNKSSKKFQNQLNVWMRGPGFGDQDPTCSKFYNFEYYNELTLNVDFSTDDVGNANIPNPRLLFNGSFKNTGESWTQQCSHLSNIMTQSLVGNVWVSGDKIKTFDISSDTSQSAPSAVFEKSITLPDNAKIVLKFQWHINYATIDGADKGVGYRPGEVGWTYTHQFTMTDCRFVWPQPKPIDLSMQSSDEEESSREL